jgi:hypothetical protein
MANKPQKGQFSAFSLSAPLAGTAILNLGRSVFGLRQEILKFCGFSPARPRLTVVNNLDHAQVSERESDVICRLVS